MLVEVHVEDWDSALRHPVDWPVELSPILEPTVRRLLALFTTYRTQATFYFLGPVAEKNPALVREVVRQGYPVGSHGYWHRHGESRGDSSDQFARQYLPPCDGYRSPFWDTTPRPGYAGGIFFRLLPRWWLRREINRTGTLWLHPHDLDSRYGPWWRRLQCGDPWEKLEHLVRTYSFRDE